MAGEVQTALLESREVIAAVIGAILGVVGTIVGTLGIEKWKRGNEVKDSERNRIASYLTAMADALGEMAEILQKREIPHMQGNLVFAINLLLSEYNSPLLAVVDREMLNEGKKLHEEALSMDTTIYNSEILTDGQLQLWKTDAEHLMAKMRVRALTIRHS